MVRVIIHAGLPKTGSSSIQAAFASQRDRLAAAGFFYPALGEPKGATTAPRIPGHWALGAYWHDAMEPATESHLIRRLTALGGAETVLAEVRQALNRALRQAEEWGEGVVLLSDEHLGYGNAGVGCRRLAAQIARRGAGLEVLAYARPDADLFPSRIQQQLKTHAHPLSQRNMTHPPMIESLRAGFGTLRLRIFARAALEAGDAVTDLCAWIGRVAGRPLPDLGPVERVNEAIPAPGCALLLAISDRADPGDDAAFSVLRWSVMASAAALGAAKLVLPEGWASRIAAQGAGAWNAMLAQSEHDATLQSALQMPPGAGAPITTAEIRAWVAQGRDPAYEAALDAWIAARPERWAPRALSLLRRG